MPRITPTIPPEIAEALEAYRQERGLATINQAAVEWLQLAYAAVTKETPPVQNRWGGDRTSEDSDPQIVPLPDGWEYDGVFGWGYKKDKTEEI